MTGTDAIGSSGRDIDRPMMLEGVPFPVCDVDSLGWRYEGDGPVGHAFTFDRSVSGLCDATVEGPQYLAVTTERAKGVSRADAYFGPLDRCVEPAGCAVDATPVLDVDRPEEMPVLADGGPDRIRVWFFDVAPAKDGFEVRTFEAACRAGDDCDPMPILPIDWEAPGSSGLSRGRFAPDDSCRYLPGNDFYAWESETGDGSVADRWSFSGGRASVERRLFLTHGDPRVVFAPSDEGEICLEPAAVAPSVPFA